VARALCKTSSVRRYRNCVGGKKKKGDDGNRWQEPDSSVQEGSVRLPISPLFLFPSTVSTSDDWSVTALLPPFPSVQSIAIFILGICESTTMPNSAVFGWSGSRTAATTDRSIPASHLLPVPAIPRPSIIWGLIQCDRTMATARVNIRFQSHLCLRRRNTFVAGFARIQPVSGDPSEFPSVQLLLYRTSHPGSASPFLRHSAYPDSTASCIAAPRR